MSDPATVDEYNKKFLANQRIEGYFTETAMVMPCPFCAAPDWTRWKVYDNAMTDYAPMRAEKTCAECGRTAKAMVEESNGGATLTSWMVQTAGPDMPPYLRNIIRDERPKTA